MKHCLSILALVATSSPLLLTSCGGSGSQYSYQNVTVTISPQVTSIPVNGTQTFTATVTNAPPDVIWGLGGSGVPNGTFTTPSPQSTSSGTYTAPAAPPIYSAFLAPNGVQGSVTLTAYSISTPSSSASAAVTFVITGPISVSLSPATASVKLGATQQLTSYAVGSTNNTLIWQVNGAAGGGTATGTISSSGLYTAPANMPMTGNTVTITAVSQADSTKVASCIVTLTP